MTTQSTPSIEVKKKKKKKEKRAELVEPEETVTEVEVSDGIQHR